MEIEDKIHGKIDIPEDISMIIATTPFQRLKHVRQLGFSYQLNPNVINYMRYEHCIGTYWMAKKMLDSIERNTIWLFDLLKSSSDDNSEWNRYLVFRKAVEVAALLHDIGHGPFSHLWEHVVEKFSHEKNASYCIDYIFALLDPLAFTTLRAHNNYGINLIKDLIIGEPSPIFPYKYRFLFEIVNNKQCKVDVDKWDYLKRDNAYMFYDTHLDFQVDDIFTEARATADGGHIEYRYEDYDKIYLMFKFRAHLHYTCYRTPKLYIRDVIFGRMMKRWPNMMLKGKRLTEITAKDMTLFLELIDDNVLELFTCDEEYKYFTDDWKIFHIDNSYAEKEMRNFFERVEISITAPGEEMPPDERILLYGDKTAKANIQRDMEKYHTIGYFLLVD